MSDFTLPISNPNLPAGMSGCDTDGTWPEVLDVSREVPQEEETGDEAETQAAFQAYFRRCEQTLARRRREREGRKPVAA